MLRMMASESSSGKQFQRIDRPTEHYGFVEPMNRALLGEWLQQMHLDYQG